MKDLHQSRSLVRMNYLKLLFFLPSLAFLCYSCVDKTTERIDHSNRLPNIVIVFTDDQGYQDLGCFGSPDIKTPHIDKLAANGTKFTNFHTAQPVCSASRASLLTGCYPNRLGLHGALMPTATVGIADEETTLAEVCKSKGYSTGIFGKWHLGHLDEFNPLRHGFDEYFGIPYSNDMWPLHPWQDSIFDFPDLPLMDGYEVVENLEDQSELTVDLTKRAVAFIEKNANNPFFLYVPHPQPHVPLFVSDQFKGSSERGLYGDVISEIDWSVGELVKALERHDLVENTLFIFTSDNGPWLSYGGHSGSAEPLREGKGTNWEGGTRVPCVMHMPGKIKKGRESDAAFMTIDLLPTIADLIQADQPAKIIDGHNMWPLISGEINDNPDDTYAFYYNRNHLQAVYSDGWKLILPHKYRTLNDNIGTDDGVPIPYEHTTIVDPELYHLDTDMSETQNVYKDHPKQVEKLEAIAESFRVRLGDAATDREGLENREPGVVESVE